MKIKKFLSSVWEFLRFTRKPNDRLFKDIEVGKAIMMRDYDEEGKPKVRVGYTKSIKSDHLIVYVPSLVENCLVRFDGVNYYIDRNQGEL